MRSCKEINPLFLQEAEPLVLKAIGNSLKKNSLIFWLKVSPKVLLGRLNQSKRKQERPLLKNNLQLETLENLCREREPFYSQADFTLETEEWVLQQTLDKIIGHIQKHKK